MPPLLPLPLPYALRNVRWQMAATSPAAALKVSQALRMRESVVYSPYTPYSSSSHPPRPCGICIAKRVRKYKIERKTKREENCAINMQL